MKRPPEKGGFFARLNGTLSSLITDARYVSRDLNEGGHHECRAGESEDKAGDEACRKGIFPDAENAQRPINADRHKRQKKPESRDRFDLVDRPPQRINEKS